MRPVKQNGARRSGHADESQYWDAVVRRDTASEGQFVYAVKSTGVYCRPGCPSRLPKRENVAFFSDCQAAETARFRACKRCNPNGISISEKSAAAVSEACRLIETSKELPKLDKLAGAVGVSPFHFHRRFKAITGLTPKAYAAAHRAKTIRAALTDPQSTVTQAISDAGYNSGSRFYEKSTETLGMTPTAYRNGGVGAEIRFTLADCSLGSILVACSEKGVCAILLGDDPDTLTHALQDRFPKARLAGGDAVFERLVSEVVGFVETSGIGLDLPPDIRGTAFQQRVWQALREIPASKKADYPAISPQSAEVGATESDSKSAACENRTKSAKCGGLETNGRRERIPGRDRCVAVRRSFTRSP